MSKIICGIDDCTRAPVLGSLICCGFGISEEKLPILDELGVRDSKELTHNQILKLGLKLKEIADKVVIHHITAKQISTGENLNDLECRAYCEIIKTIPAKHYYINNFDHDDEHFFTRAKILGYNLNKSKIILGHNNENEFKVIAAASIIAKAESIWEYRLYKDTFEFDFGWGSPSDPKTIEFLKKFKDDPRAENFIRWNWKTIKRVLGDKYFKGR